MNFYFDESIRDNGKFVLGALVGSKVDLTEAVRSEWRQLGLDPDNFEYKSYTLKNSNTQLVDAREKVNYLLRTQAKLGIVVVPLEKRKFLGQACVNLMEQLNEKGHLLGKGNCYLYTDQGIYFSHDHICRLESINVKSTVDCDSLSVAGIQIADHAAHILGSMLLEELGYITKHVPSTYPPEYQVESVSLGWELWSGVRYNFFSEVDYDPEDDESLPYAVVDGHGLIITEECSNILKNAARRSFGKSYLGCTV